LSRIHLVVATFGLTMQSNTLKHLIKMLESGG